MLIIFIIGQAYIYRHDREFVSSLATRVVEIKDQQVIDFQGTFDEYQASQAASLKAA